MAFTANDMPDSSLQTCTSPLCHKGFVHTVDSMMFLTAMHRAGSGTERPAPGAELSPLELLGPSCHVTPCH